MAKADRSEHFREWLKEGMTEEKIEILVSLEKQTRLLVHVYDLVQQFDAKVFHALARVSHQLRSLYEPKK